MKYRSLKSVYDRQIPRSELGINLKSGKYPPICEYIFPDLGIEHSNLGDITRSSNVKFPDLGIYLHSKSQIQTYSQIRHTPIKKILAKFSLYVRSNCVEEKCDRNKCQGIELIVIHELFVSTELPNNELTSIRT